MHAGLERFEEAVCAMHCRSRRWLRLQRRQVLLLLLLLILLQNQMLLSRVQRAIYGQIRRDRLEKVAQIHQRVNGTLSNQRAHAETVLA